MSNEKPTYEELEQRLAEVQRVVDALRDGEVDAIISERDVSLLRLKDVENALRRSEEAVRLQRDQLIAHSRILRSILSTHELDELLGLILDEVLSLLGVEFASIHLLQKEGLVLRCWRGFSDELCAHMHFFSATDPPNWTRQPCIVHERLSEHGNIPDFAKRDGIQVWASIPLHLPSPRDVEEGEWLGTVLVGSHHYETLNKEEVRLFQGLSDQLALSIDHARAYRAARERLARLQILRSIDSAIIQGEDTRVALRNVVNMIPAGLVADAVAISMLDEEHCRTEVFVMRLPGGVLVEEEAFTLAESLLHWFVERQEPVIIYDLIQDPRVRMYRPRNHIDKLVSYLGVPLVARGRTIGILHILTTQPRIFADEDIVFFRTLAGQAAIAVANARLFAELQQELAERKQQEMRIQVLSYEIIAAREEERKQVSYILHHDVGSLAVGLAAQFDAIEDDLRLGKSKEALKWMKRARKLFDAAVARLKDLAVQLRPLELDVLGLRAALRQYFSHVTKDTGIRIHFRETVGRRRVTGDAATILFRIAQEALTNAITHGHAKQADVELRASKNEFTLTVHDNGKGFEPSEQSARATPQMGLRVMLEMAASAGGTFSIDSGPRKGTTVRVSLPLASAALGPGGAMVREKTLAGGKTPRPAGRGARARKRSRV